MCHLAGLLAHLARMGTGKKSVWGTCPRDRAEKTERAWGWVTWPRTSLGPAGSSGCSLLVIWSLQFQPFCSRQPGPHGVGLSGWVQLRGEWEQGTQGGLVRTLCSFVHLSLFLACSLFPPRAPAGVDPHLSELAGSGPKFFPLNCVVGKQAKQPKHFSQPLAFNLLPRLASECQHLAQLLSHTLRPWCLSWSCMFSPQLWHQPVNSPAVCQFHTGQTVEVNCHSTGQMGWAFYSCFLSTSKVSLKTYFFIKPVFPALIRVFFVSGTRKNCHQDTYQHTAPEVLRLA